MPIPARRFRPLGRGLAIPGRCEPKTAPEVRGPPAGADDLGPTIPGRNCEGGEEPES